MSSVETAADKTEPPDRVRVLRNLEQIDEIADYWRACGQPAAWEGFALPCPLARIIP